MVNLSDIEDQAYRRRILAMLELHEQMWLGHVVEIKGVSHRIEFKQGSRPIPQEPYRAGPQLHELIE